MNNRAPNDYALGHNHDELQRLIGQSRFLGELTEELLRAAGIRPGMRALDVGLANVSFVDTLAERLQRAVQMADATVVAPLFVGAWAHKP